MSTYLFECNQCHEVIETVESADRPHEATCPKCNIPAKRVYTTPQVKKNTGFYSDVLGCQVDSQTDYEEKLRKHRFKTGIKQYVDDNSNPRDEWVEEKELENAQMIREENENEEKRAQEYPDYYDSVSTYEDTNRR